MFSIYALPARRTPTFRFLLLFSPLLLLSSCLFEIQEFTTRHQRNPLAPLRSSSFFFVVASDVGAGTDGGAFHRHKKSSSHRNLIDGGEKNHEANRVLKAASTEGKSELNVLVCLMYWTNHPDRPQKQPRENYEKLFNAKGRDPELYPGGTVGDYFETMSYGNFKLNFFVQDWIGTTYDEQHFTLDGSRGMTQDLQLAFDPVLQRLDDNSFDFGPFDSDGNGELDLTIFIHSGYDGLTGQVDCETGATPDRRISSHARNGASISEFVSSAGIRLGPYSVAPAFVNSCGLKLGAIGIILHETIHTFDLPDLYDNEVINDPTNNSLGGIDYYDVMANTAGQLRMNSQFPGHMSAWSKIQIGFANPILIEKDGPYEIRPVELYPDVYKIAKGFANEKEYLLIENRQPIEGDFDANFFPPGGIVVYHVDENIWDEYPMDSESNYPRGGPFQSDWPGNGKHYPVAILQADGLYELEQGINGGEAGDLWNDPSQRLGPGGNGNYPNTDSYAFGQIKPTGLILTGFRFLEGNTMSFYVCGMDGTNVQDCLDDAAANDFPVESPTASGEPPLPVDGEAPVAAPAILVEDPSPVEDNPEPGTAPDGSAGGSFKLGLFQSIIWLAAPIIPLFL